MCAWRSSIVPIQLSNHASWADPQTAKTNNNGVSVRSSWVLGLRRCAREEIDMEHANLPEELRLAISRLLAAASLVDAGELKDARRAIADACSHCKALLTEIDAQIQQ